MKKKYKHCTQHGDILSDAFTVLMVETIGSCRYFQHHFHFICPFLNFIMLYCPIEVISNRFAAKIFLMQL